MESNQQIDARIYRVRAEADPLSRVSGLAAVSQVTGAAGGNAREKNLACVCVGFRGIEERRKSALCPKEVATELGVSERSARRYMASGVIPSFRVGPKLWRCWPASLAQYGA